MSVRIICLAIGYVFGLFQTSYIIGKRHGIDIRDYGSGNAGTTNMMRTMGTRAGLITFAGDCLKCILAVALVRVLFRAQYSSMMHLLVLYTAAGVILGHNFPFYLNFRGGKGIAATAGLVLSFHPVMAVLGIITFFGIFFTTHYVSLGSLAVYAGLMIEIVIFGQMGWFDLSQNQLIELYILMALLTALAYWKHRGNIRRLLEGTERKTYLTKKSQQ